MPQPFRKILTHLIAAMALLGSTAYAQAANLSALPDQQGTASKLQADATGTLHFVLNGKKWQLPGWPATLPRKLPEQTLQVTTSRHPAGPVRRLQLSQRNARAPWLILMSAAPKGQQITEGWRIQHIDRQGLELEDAQHHRTMLALGQTLRLSDCQRLGLLAVDMPEENTATVTEREPRADWYLVTEKHCRR